MQACKLGNSTFFPARNNLVPRQTSSRIRNPSFSGHTSSYIERRASRYLRKEKKMKLHSFLYQALIGVTDELGMEKSLASKLVTIIKHVLRFAIELLSMLTAIPYGYNTAILARSIPQLQKTPASILVPPSTTHPDQQPQPSNTHTTNSTTPPQTQQTSPLCSDGNKYGVLVDRGVKYGPRVRQALDAYVPLKLAQLQHGGQQQHALAPVVLFTHGGIWASGETWHYTWLGTRLAQMGFVVLIHTYTLYPEALIPQMVEETSQALSWAQDNVQAMYGGDPTRINCIGHSAGAHLVALVLLHRTQKAGTRATPVQQQQQQQESPSQQKLQHDPQQNESAHGLKRHPMHPCIRISDGRMPASFVGISGVYDICAHYEYEKSRGVHLLSMMARAFGHKPHFDALSPSVLLEACMHCRAMHSAGKTKGHPLQEAVAVGASSTKHQQQLPGQQQQKPQEEWRQLMDEQEQQRLEAQSDLQTAHCVAVLQQAGLDSNIDLARHLPPCVFMGSNKDFMVPFTSGQKMAAALRRCGVPARELQYNQVAHSEFVTAWPLMSTQELQACCCGEVPGARLEKELIGLPPYAYDLAIILQGL